MTLTEGRLRAALQETAGHIRAGTVPPLALPADDGHRARGPWPGRRPRRWRPALAAAAAVCLTIGLSVTLAGGSRPRAPVSPLASSALTRLPQFYVALQQSGDVSGNYVTKPDRAVVRSTLTGSTLATVAVPGPYGTFAFVQGTADDDVFILGAQHLSTFSTPVTRLYLLKLNPSAPAGRRAQVSALPVPLLPTAGGGELCWTALSPNGHLLATTSTKTAGNIPTQLQVFDLITGRSRTWVLPAWASRLDTYQDVTGPPTWDTDSRNLAFFSRSKDGSADLVLLDTSAPAASFGADTRSVPLPRPSGTDGITFGPDAPLLTPDGQHVIENLVNLHEAAHPLSGPLHAFGLDVINLRTGAVTRLRQHSLLFYVLASDPSGSAVIVSLENLTRSSAGFAVWTARGTTPIQLPAGTIAVAW
jgi:hypothetical protein